MTALFPASPDTVATTQASTAHTDFSIASATGSSQSILAANVDRREAILHNFSDKDWWINPTGGTAAVNTAGNVRIPKSGGTLVLNNTNAITGIGTTGKALTVLEG